MRTPKIAPQETDLITQALKHTLKTHTQPDAFFLLALSGGIDSVVLLHTLVQLKKDIPFNLHALHVHHGLNQHAESWAKYCQKLCEELQTPLKVVRVKVDKSSELGVEAAARALRYEALMEYAHNNKSPDFILTAHHQQDQAETLLLQLFRGAGVKGLASMAMVDLNRRILRPILEIPQSEIKAYAAMHQLQWCEDDSNSNTAFERNFLRHEVLPILEKRTPAIHRILARTASHMAEANSLLDSLAQIDAKSLIQNNSLCLEGLGQLGVLRAKNVLRWWLARLNISMPSADLLNEILDQLINAKSDAQMNIQLQKYHLKRYQQRAYLVIEAPVFEFDMLWQGESSLQIPNGSILYFKEVKGHGLALKFAKEKLRITNRKGGERFKPDVNRPTRTLKHLLQEANIPPWHRAQIPLIYWQDTLAFVPQIGIYNALEAHEDEYGIQIEWSMPDHATITE